MPDELPNDQAVLRERFRRASLWLEWVGAIIEAGDRLLWTFDAIDRRATTPDLVEAALRAWLDAFTRPEPFPELSIELAGPPVRGLDEFSPAKLARLVARLRARHAAVEAFARRVEAKLEAKATPEPKPDPRTPNERRDDEAIRLRIETTWGWTEIADEIDRTAAEGDIFGNGDNCRKRAERRVEARRKAGETGLKLPKGKGGRRQG